MAEWTTRSEGVMERRRQSAEVAALVALFSAITILTVVGFASRQWMPALVSEHGAGVDRLIRYLLYTTGAVFVIGHLVLIGFIWRYGRGRDAPPPRTTVRAERWWSVVPVVGMALIAEVGVLVMGMPVWKKVYGTVPADAETVEVTARQFEWLIRYPGRDRVFGRVDPRLVSGLDNPVGLDTTDMAALDDIVIRNRLRVPVGRPIHLRLRSHDVLHSFSVPAFRSKQDIVPGMIGSTQFVPTQSGEYEIGCAELCGMAHYRMRGIVMVLPPEEYRAWLRDQKGRFE